jgi:hypothetical protein
VSRSLNDERIVGLCIRGIEAAVRPLLDQRDEEIAALKKQVAACDERIIQQRSQLAGLNLCHDEDLKRIEATWQLWQEAESKLVMLEAENKQLRTWHEGEAKLDKSNRELIAKVNTDVQGA